MQPDVGETAYLVAAASQYVALRTLVAESPVCIGLGDTHKADLAAELASQHPALPQELARMTPDAQRVRVDGELSALKKHDLDAFSGSFTPSYLVAVWRCLGLITADHMLYAADAMDADIRRREIRRCRRLLREAGKEIPIFDPGEYPLAAPNARRAHSIERQRIEASKPYAAKPAGTNGTIAGPSRKMQSKESQAS